MRSVKLVGTVGTSPAYPTPFSNDKYPFWRKNVFFSKSAFEAYKIAHKTNDRMKTLTGWPLLCILIIQNSNDNNAFGLEWNGMKKNLIEHCITRNVNKLTNKLLIIYYYYYNFNQFC